MLGGLHLLAMLLARSAIAVGLLSPDAPGKPDGCAGDAADCTGDYAADDACVDLKKDRSHAGDSDDDDALHVRLVRRHERRGGGGDPSTSPR